MFYDHLQFYLLLDLRGLLHKQIDPDQNGDNYFVNLGYQFTFEKPKMDLNLSWRNILNTDTFINAYNNQYYYVQSSYQLRPSQVLATLKFTL